MNCDNWKTGFMGNAKYRVLEALEREGALTVPELPRTWPVTRQLLDFLIEHLVEAGFARRHEGGRVSAVPEFEITPLGSALLQARPVQPMTTIQIYRRPVGSARSLAAG